MNQSHPILGNSVEETLAYIHMKAVRKGTVESYKTAVDEINGVWLLLKHLLGDIPYYSMLTLNLQNRIIESMYDEEERRTAKNVLIRLEENKS